MVMEQILFLSAFLVFCLLLAKLIKKAENKNGSKPKLPPGPKALPIIGNMHQLIQGGRLPHRVLRDLAKEYGPLMHLKFGEVSTVIVSSTEIAKEIFTTHDINFARRPTYFPAFRIVSYGCIDILFSPYGKYWRELRKLCNTELLSQKRVHLLRPLRGQEVSNLIKWISSQEGSAVNLSQKIFAFTFGFTARAAFGKPNPSTEKFMHLLPEIIRLSLGFNLGDLYPSVKIFQWITGTSYKLKAIHKQIDEIVQNILNEHREEMMKPKDLGIGEAKEDLVDVLLKIQASGDLGVPLSDNHLKAVIYDIFAGGSETSSTTLEWAVSEVIRNPRILQRAQDEVREVFDGKGDVDESRVNELKYLDAIIKETLRLHPSAPLLIPRESKEAIKLDGYDIPAKTRLFVNDWALGRDPKYWKDAETFSPERFLDSEIDYKGYDFEYLPFGAGRRICPGIYYALANVTFPLAQFLFHFDWKLPGDMNPEELDMTEFNGITARRSNDLHLIPIPYSGSSLVKMPR